MEAFLHSSLSADPEGLYNTTQKVMVKPRISDHGSLVNCKAVQFDKENHKLFDDASAEPVKLNVTFPPQPTSNKSLNAEAGTNLTIKFEFKSNPMPTRIDWCIKIPAVVQSPKFRHLLRELKDKLENETQTVTLSPGHNDDKYQVFETEAIGELSFSTSMVIFNVEKTDHDDEYYIEVENSRGTQKYFFEVSVDNGDDTNGGNGDDGGVTTETHADIAVIIVIAFIIALIFLSIGFYIMYRRNQSVNEITPLSTRGQ